MSDMRKVGGRKNTPQVVGNDGRAWVQALTHEAFFHAGLRGDAYSVLTEVDLTDGLLTPLSWIQNNDTALDSGHERLCVINELVISADANVHLEVFLAEGYTSGGADKIPLNINRGSTRKAQVTVKDGSSAPLVLDGLGSETQSLFIAGYAPYTHPVNILLPSTKTLAVKAMGAAGNKVRVEMNLFFLPVSTD